ncbi:MAG: hypothetical protein ABI456_10050 [Ktedonobacteraceae bacterium]|nr:hypothetical protein [Chloroflexota bacterium]
MTTNGSSTHTQQHPSLVQRRLSHFVSGWTIRLLIAFIISWLIILAFFVSGVVSH